MRQPGTREVGGDEGEGRNGERVMEKEGRGGTIAHEIGGREGTLDAI